MFSFRKLFNAAISHFQPKAESLAPKAERQKFVLLTGDFGDAAFRLNGRDVTEDDFDHGADALEIENRFTRRPKSLTDGSTTYILWGSSKDVPSVLKNGVRLQKDLGDMNDKIVDLSQDKISIDDKMTVTEVFEQTAKEPSLNARIEAAAIRLRQTIADRRLSLPMQGPRPA